MNEIVNRIGDAMASSMGAGVAVLLLSMIPIAEARLAIPFGIGMGLSPAAAFGWAFLGSSLVAPALLLLFIPAVTALSKTKLFSRLGQFLFDKFEKKSRALSDKDESTGLDPTDTSPPPENRHALSRSDIKRICGVALFVAVPLPMTGVWTGSAVAAILKIGFFKSLVGILAGNAAACGIITLISYLFEPYVNYITLGFFAIVAVALIALIIKIALYKPERP